MKIGDVVANIKLVDQDNNEYNLYDLKNDYFVLYFYPKDSTSGCTVEALGYKALNDEFLKLGVKILGISKDSIKSHQKFICNNELPFTLISDTSLELVNYFNVYKEKTMYGRKYLGIVRTTFVLDKDYKIIKINEKVNTKTDAEDVYNFIKNHKLIA